MASASNSIITLKRSLCHFRAATLSASNASNKLINTTLSSVLLTKLRIMLELKIYLLIMQYWQPYQLLRWTQIRHRAAHQLPEKMVAFNIVTSTKTRKLSSSAKVTKRCFAPNVFWSTPTRNTRSCLSPSKVCLTIFHCFMIMNVFFSSWNEADGERDAGWSWLNW